VGALVWYWVTRATTEGQRWLNLFLDAAPDGPRTNTGAHFLRGFLAILQADPITARRELERAADAERTAGTSRQLAETLAMASVAANMAGDHASGQQLCDEARAAAEELKDAEAMLASFQAEAMNGFFSGDLDTLRPPRRGTSDRRPHRRPRDPVPSDRRPRHSGGSHWRPLSRRPALRRHRKAPDRDRRLSATLENEAASFRPQIRASSTAPRSTLSWHPC